VWSKKKDSENPISTAICPSCTVIAKTAQLSILAFLHAITDRYCYSKIFYMKRLSKNEQKQLKGGFADSPGTCFTRCYYPCKSAYLSGCMDMGGGIEYCYTAANNHCKSQCNTACGDSTEM
jgi:hypothetical protein